MQQIQACQNNSALTSEISSMTRILHRFHPALPCFESLSADTAVFIAENRRFAVPPSLLSLNQDTDNLSANNNKDLVDNRPLSSLVTGNDCNILFNTSNCFAYSSPERRLSVAPKRNVKRHKRPCAYCANTSATLDPNKTEYIQLYLVPVAPLESEPHCLLAVTFS